ncbi:prohead core scaffold protein and protease [Paraglaciecola Antarctic GD virus 1]|nr:prohead core scaffold protein and protease [Paraglaciecola Antarctic GD virus 1]
MSLIVESQVEVFEVKNSTNGELFIEGVCMVADVVNKNKRLYPKRVMQEAVDRYNKNYISEMKALGELNHPPRPDADPAEASHLIVSMKMVGEKVYAKAKVLDTPRGKILKGLVEGGWRVQTSSRGLGNLQEKTANGQKFNEVTDFNITVGFDVVQNQSAPGAVMVGVYESVGNDYVNVHELSEKSMSDWSLVLEKMGTLESLNEAKAIDVNKELLKINSHIDMAADMADKLYTKMQRADTGDQRAEKVVKSYKEEMNKMADNAARMARTFKTGK